MKEKIKRWYRQGLWSKEMVQESQQAGVITQEECTEILGEEVYGV